MRLVSLRPALATACAAAVCLVMSAYPGAATTGLLERFVGTAVTMYPSGPEINGPIDIVIEHWSTDRERDSLRGTLMSGGAGTLLAALQGVRYRAGFAQVPGLLAHGARSRGRYLLDIQFAREIKTPTGRQVIVALDKPWRFDEDGSPSRSQGSAFTLIDIRLGPDGTGVGKLSPASQVTYNKTTETLELADYSKQPVRLKDVTSAKP